MPKSKKSKKPAIDCADIVLDNDKVASANQKAAKNSDSSESTIQGDIELDSPHVS